MNSPIRAIVFDFGRVLADFDHMKSCRALAAHSEYSQNQIYDFVFQSGLEKAYDEGKTTSHEFYDSIITITKANGISFDDFSRIWGDIFSANREMECLIEKIGDDVDLFLLSNTNRLHWQYIKQLPIIKNHFCGSEQLTLSFEVGVRKPNKKIFNLCIKNTGFSPREILYIDDISQFVQEFVSLGVRGINYDLRKHSIRSLEKELWQLGILPNKLAEA